MSESSEEEVIEEEVVEEEEEEEELDEAEKAEVLRRVRERLSEVSPTKQKTPAPTPTKVDEIARFEAETAAGERKLQAVRAGIESSREQRRRKLDLLHACARGDAAAVEDLLLASSSSAAAVANAAIADPAAGVGPRLPLQVAVDAGSEAVVRVLLAAGADVRAVPAALRTACAAKGGGAAIVAYLLRFGADPAALDGVTGLGAIHIACRAGDALAVGTLLAHDPALVAQRTANEHKWAPLHMAANYGAVDVAAELLDHGADVNDVAPGVPSDTPLQVAARGKNLAMVEFLVSRGANVNAGREKRLPTPLQLASVGGGGDAVVAFLLAHGAEQLPTAFKPSSQQAVAQEPSEVEMLRRRVAELEQALREKDEIIAQLRGNQSAST